MTRPASGRRTREDPALGATRHTALSAARPAYDLGLHLRGHLPEEGQGRRSRRALLQHKGHGAPLKEISPAVAPGAHAVLLDQAGWPVSAKLKVPDTITLLPLPPRPPELNPVETVWPFVRDNGLSNRIFGSSEEIVDHGCEAWNKLIEPPWIIRSIGLRDWAHAF